MAESFGRCCGSGYDSGGHLTKTRGASYTCDAGGRTDTLAADATTNRYVCDTDDNLTRTTLPSTPVEDRAYDPVVG
ncbi:hypothetical protein [Streptomyces sp. NPDC057199]|uniref:hypothetical protein n=1 Tax=Streptomyces sp. NPDC057199 TaxID=3346047 RepID=UPI0036276DF5